MWAMLQYAAQVYQYITALLISTYDLRCVVSPDELSLLCLFEGGEGQCQSLLNKVNIQTVDLLGTEKIIIIRSNKHGYT